MITAMRSTVKKKPSKRLVRETPKPRPVKRRSSLPRATEIDVMLFQVLNTPTKGSGVGGCKWRIEVEGIRAGEVYINVINEPPLGIHASIQIYLNIKSQGRGIGRIAYLKACQSS